MLGSEGNNNDTSDSFDAAFSVSFNRAVKDMPAIPPRFTTKGHASFEKKSILLDSLLRYGIFR